MKKILFVLCLGLMFGGCEVTHDSLYQDTYGVHCPNPQFVTSTYLDDAVYYRGFKVADCLKYAQERYGLDVSITNIQWDVNTFKVRKSVIFDVVKCESED